MVKVDFSIPGKESRHHGNQAVVAIRKKDEVADPLTQLLR